jgi:hypothetical protein
MIFVVFSSFETFLGSFGSLQVLQLDLSYFLVYVDPQIWVHITDFPGDE